MHGLRFTPALLVLLAASPAILNSQTDPVLARFIQPNSKALISIDWKYIRQSGVGARLRAKLLPAGGTVNMPLPGIEILNDVDRVLISSSGRKAGDGAEEQPPVLIALAGHFDLAKVRSALESFGAKPQMFNSIQVYRPQNQDGKDMAIVPLDPQTILLGDAAPVFASLERNTSFSPLPDANSVVTRAAEMDAKYNIWVIASDLNALTGKNMTGTFGFAQLAGEIHNFEAGVSLKNGLAADVSVLCESESEAKNLALEMEKLIKPPTKDKAGPLSAFDLANKVRFNSEGSIAKMSLQLTTQELETGAVLAASRMQQHAGAIAKIRPVVGPAPNPPKEEKKVIRIDGLDDGPRVIPYNQQ